MGNFRIVCKILQDCILPFHISPVETLWSKSAKCDAESVNRSQIEVKQTAVIGSLCVLLDNSTVQLHDSLDSRRACARSEVGFSSQNGDHA
jgi:hypothetical protein